ncbi:TetR/AcrR family transcriptional regulator [Actinoallomurus bryophytorum]|uniref:TetR family transcriptional regulator n=1 Tax=Actinoallomurus bryophytorum TaxID=1490222 RepID=A0A543CVH8_9ACTN|nr:TetR/AcrR family transcriptional regulator [Actinoallomurus bryophytorum]TQM01113.1 TetR family transcriptional regulator [Actinoallomurus bryophytorum]
MPRTKEFDRDQALRRAAEVFWDRGYEAASTDELLTAMGIGRQSMYNAFGDKRRLYLEALQHYQAETGAEMFERLRTAASPLGALSGVLLAIARQSADERRRGCMAVNAATEFGQADQEIGAIVNAGVNLCHVAYERVLAEAKRKGEVRPDLDERAAARFLHSTLVGLRVSARSGAAPEMLHDIATVAIDGLRAR